MRFLRGHGTVDGAGVQLYRIIGSPQLSYVDPFVLLDEFRSDNPEDYVAGFPSHPHRGIETITYMIDGRFRHRDSKGGGGVLTPGTVQWMTAGRGIVHSEMPDMDKGMLWGYQLWLTLPARDKMVPPRYQHLAADAMPVVKGDGVCVKVIAGGFGGASGPAKTWFPIDYFDVRLGSTARFERDVPAGFTCLLYVHSGSVIVDPDGEKKEAHRGDLVLMGRSDRVVVRGLGNEGGLLFISGQPLNEPIVRGGPFVMNTREEIRQAFEDYQNGVLF
jgi:quercetin 2,3-dioxygenase